MRPSRFGSVAWPVPFRRSLPLGVLRSLASALETDFLALLDPRVASQQLSPLQGGAEILVGAHQSPCDAVANRPDLTRNPATDDAHCDVEPVPSASKLKRLEERGLIDRPATEIIGRGTAIHGDPSRSGIEPNARNRGFPSPYCPDVSRLCHVCQPLLQFRARLIVDYSALSGRSTS